MNYEEHVLSGILTYPLVILLASFLKHYANLPFELTTLSMIVGYGVYVLGSDLPDLDHPDSLIHMGVKPLVALMVGGAVFVKGGNLVSVGNSIVDLTLGWAIAALFAFASWYVFSALMPRHRGIVHSLAFASIYGIVIFASFERGLGFKFGEALFIGFAAFLGYTLHLIVDREVKVI
ncbi:metal-dependent hydrolase [Thermococcus aggregans]|uniref:Metal-dependent hydrolase n=1 Tax=Thermococcus aggregans TaxID=110163 RepID=A0A9E7SNE6_THEAG|nr:metal-dependent hydrolase [Thermococcus aggregans]USS40285.1 metal-dependent hydrolase [Thermococcus aggregans]